MKNIYLDQNHWIYLARDAWGQPHKESHRGISNELRRMVDADVIRIPVSILHFIECLHSVDPGRRASLAKVFDEYSRSWQIATLDHVLPAEMALAIRRVLGFVDSTEPPSIFGKGFLFGLGAQVTQMLRQRWSKAELKTLTALSALPGATLDLLATVVTEARDMQSSLSRDTARRYADAAEQLRQTRQGIPKNVHRRVHWASYTVDYQELLRSALLEQNVPLSRFYERGPDFLGEFWSSIPTLDVGCELTIYRDRQWTRSVEANDMVDIGHLAIAVPYCDVVVTERFWRRAIEETRVDQKYDTVVYAGLEDLRQYLEMAASA